MPGFDDLRAGYGDEPYGWCALCQHFTEFPHECAAEREHQKVAAA